MDSGTEEEIDTLARQLGAALLDRGWTVTCAESCTGGGVAEAITRIPGSSSWFGFGFVTYADHAKQEMLGVSAQTLAAEGAVSETVVREMAEAARCRSGADLAVAVSGIAGPDGGSADKPVGTVWICWSGPGGTGARRFHFEGDRAAVRDRSVVAALQGLLKMAGVPSE